MIKCVICGYTADKMLGTHLRYQHKMTTKEYKESYHAETTSPEYKSMIAERNSSDKMRQMIADRNRDPEFIQKVVNGMRNSEKYHDSKSAQFSKMNKENWKSEEYRRRKSTQVSESQRRIMNTPERLALSSATLRACWMDPEKSVNMLNSHKNSPFGRASYYTSLKTNRTYYCRSQGELELIYVLEILEDVIDIIQESERIPYGNGRTYIPDYKVITDHGSYLMEVKYDESYDEYMDKVMSTIEYCKLHDYKFCWMRRFIEIPKLKESKSIDDVTLVLLKQG